MNYQKIYNDLIQKRRINYLKKNGKEYCERHHIIPRSLGGTDNFLNLVNLTAKEHFIAHLLLWRIYKDRNDKEAEGKMVCAIYRMVFGNAEFNKNFQVNIYSRKYDNLRKSYSEFASERMLNTKVFHKKNGQIKFFKLEEIANLDSSWIPGTGIKNFSNKGMIRITNVISGEIRFIKKDQEIPFGWIIGNAESKTNNTKWITNGKTNKKIKNGEEVPNGFYYGRILPKKFKKFSDGKTAGTKGLVEISNIKTGKHKFVKPELVKSFVFENSNWIEGRFKKRSFSEQAKINIRLAKLKTNYPNLNFDLFDLNTYLSLETKQKRQKYIRELLDS